MGQYNISIDELEDEIVFLMEGLEGDYTLSDFLQAAKSAWEYMQRTKK